MDASQTLKKSALCAALTAAALAATAPAGAATIDWATWSGITTGAPVKPIWS